MLSSCRGSVLMRIHPAHDLGEGIRNATVAEAVPQSDRAAIVGMVIFTTHRGERAEAILDDQGRWRCPELPVLDRVLNILFEPREGATADVSAGHDALHRVAAWLKGVVQA